MANQYNNEIIYNGQTLINLKNDTVTSEKVLSGETFHDRSGAPQTGSMITHNVHDGLDSASTDDALSANMGRVLNSNLGTATRNSLNGESAIKTYLSSVASGLGMGDSKLISISNNDSGFTLMTAHTTYVGYMYVTYKSGSETHFVWTGYNPEGKDITFGNANGAWTVNSVNGKIGNVPFDLTFNKNVITDLYVRFSNCFYCPMTKTVHLEFGILSSSGKIPESGNAEYIATVPNEYRPKLQSIQTMGIISNTSNAWTVDKYEALFVDTGGTLKFGNWLRSGTVRVLYVNTDYRIE